MPEPPLTSRGEQRREAILRLMKQAASHRRLRRRRQVSGVVGACAVLALTATLAIRLLRPRDRGAAVSPSVEIAKAPTAPSAPVEPSPRSPAVIIGTIETDPTILSRWSVAPDKKGAAADTVEVITDDDDLIHSLADAGQHAGIIEVNGQATLVTSSANQ